MFQTQKFKNLKRSQIGGIYLIFELMSYAQETRHVYCCYFFFNQIIFKIKTMFQTAENNQQHFKSIGFPVSCIIM